MTEEAHEKPQDNIANKNNLESVTDLQDYYDALDQLEKQNGHLQNYDTDYSNFSSSLNRWPTLFEILNKKTQPPLDLWSFYVFMRDEENAIDYLDFWIDTVQHINLCKAYVKNLRDSLVANSRTTQAGQINEILIKKKEEGLENKSGDNINKEINETKVPLPERTPAPSSFIADDSIGNRNSQNSSTNSKTSSMLLDLLMKNDLFEGQDTHRLSVFLRGEGEVRSSDPLINAKIDKLKRQSQIAISETAGVVDEGVNENSRSNSTRPGDVRNGYRVSRINPEIVETFIQQDFDEKHRDFDQSHVINRTAIKKSSKNILVTYFSLSSEKKIELPSSIVEKLRFALEEQGRDDPEVFDEAREYVFKALEYNAYPNFLRNNALKNVTKKSAIVRLLVSMICGFAGFWAGYTLIFMDYQPKPTRAVVVVPFFLMSYAFFSAFYRIDPFLCIAGFSESSATAGGIIPIKEKYVKSLLNKRSLFVLCIICLVGAAFSIIFALVPGKRLLHS